MKMAAFTKENFRMIRSMVRESCSCLMVERLKVLGFWENRKARVSTSAKMVK